jgi:hypothetical protein
MSCYHSTACDQTYLAYLAIRTASVHESMSSSCCVEGRQPIRQWSRTNAGLQWRTPVQQVLPLIGRKVEHLSLDAPSVDPYLRTTTVPFASMR